MLRDHFLLQWYNRCDLTMQEPTYDTPIVREFAKLDEGEDNLPGKSTLLRFRHLFEASDLSLQMLATLTAKGLLLKQGSVVDATLITAPSSTKNSTGTSEPKIHQDKKGNQWHQGMKTHIGIDVESDLLHSVATTAANVHDMTQSHALQHVEGTDVFTG